MRPTTSNLASRLQAKNHEHGFWLHQIAENERIKRQHAVGRRHLGKDIRNPELEQVRNFCNPFDTFPAQKRPDCKWVTVRIGKL